MAHIDDGYADKPAAAGRVPHKGAARRDTHKVARTHGLSHCVGLVENGHVAADLMVLLETVLLDAALGYHELHVGKLRSVDRLALCQWRVLGYVAA